MRCGREEGRPSKGLGGFKTDVLGGRDGQVRGTASLSGGRGIGESAPESGPETPRDCVEADHKIGGDGRCARNRQIAFSSPLLPIP